MKIMKHKILKLLKFRQSGGQRHLGCFCLLRHSVEGDVHRLLNKLDDVRLRTFQRTLTNFNELYVLGKVREL